MRRPSTTLSPSDASTTSTLISLSIVLIVAAAENETIRNGHDVLPYQTRFYFQTLDHLSPSPSKHCRWAHRYLINDDYFGRPSDGKNGRGWISSRCPGPILLYTGNEGPITGFWEGNGFMHSLARKWGGLLLFPEERYYGESIPSEDRSYLTTEQVLSDYVELLDHVKRDYGAGGCPVVAFGGSYGGTLATFLRASRPDAVIGALAASAPVGYYDPDGWEGHGVDGYTWADIAVGAYRDAHPRCLEAIWAATDAIEEAGSEEVMDAFHLCSFDGLQPRQSSLFLYALEGLPQENYPYEIGRMPAWPIKVVCSSLASALEEKQERGSNGLLEAAANVTFLALRFQPSSGKCFPTLKEGPGNIPGDGPGLGSWGYQSCTETLHQFSSKGPESGGLRRYDFNMTLAKQICEDTWGAGVVPNATALTTKFGGYQLGDGLTNISNIIWSVGLLDPWTGGCFRSRSWKTGDEDRKRRGVHFFEMPNGAHHLDLRGGDPKDPKDVRDVRRKEEEIIRGWIERWSRTKEGKLAVPVVEG